MGHRLSLGAQLVVAYLFFLPFMELHHRDLITSHCLLMDWRGDRKNLPRIPLCAALPDVALINGSYQTLTIMAPPSMRRKVLIRGRID
jgi:hypothetical protein